MPNVGFGANHFVIGFQGGRARFFKHRLLSFRVLFKFSFFVRQSGQLARRFDLLCFFGDNLRRKPVDVVAAVLFLYEVPEAFRMQPFVFKRLPGLSRFGFFRKALHLFSFIRLQDRNFFQVCTRCRQARFRFPTPLLVFTHPSRFFQVDTEVLGLRFKEFIDHSLTDDGVGARPQPCPEENVLYVATTNLLTVDEVGVRAVLRDDAPDRQFRVGFPRPLHLSVAVVENHLHARARGGGTTFASCENQVRHGALPAQFARPPLTQHPADGIDHIGLTAPVGAHNSAQSTRKFNRRRVGKALETA